MTTYKTLNCAFSDKEIMALDEVSSILDRLHDILLDEGCTNVETDEAHADFDINEVNDAQCLVYTLSCMDKVILS